MLCHAKHLISSFWCGFTWKETAKNSPLQYSQKKSNINSDSLGRNSIATFSIKNQTFVLTSGYDNPNLLGLNIFDISKITNREVTEITSHIYSYLNFSSEVEALQRFNIRDIKSFSPIFSPNSKISKAEKYHFIIMSWFNNGLIYFKGINLNNTFSFNSEAEEIKYLQLSYIYNITGIGKIFTEKEYYNDTKVEFFFYSSTSYPPVVYEFLVDEYLNMNINRIYDSNFVEQIRYAGNDMIAVNENFIAFLLYDLKSLVQTIRVFYRDETNFGLGHTHIPLLNLKSPISAMRFLSFNTANDIFVINPEKWSIERINDYEIIFNLYNKKEEYLPYWNRTFEAIIKAMNEDKTATYLQLKFNITFANQTDMDSYYIESNVVQTIDWSYGDNLFNFSISEFYSGPDLRFEYRLNSSSLLESDTKIFNTFDLSINEKISSFDYQEDNIVLPKIVNTFAEEIQTHKFNSSYSWTKNIIWRFSDRLSGEQMVSIFLTFR